MKRSIIFCTVLMLVGVVGANAQTRQYSDKTNDAQKTTQTKTIDSKATQVAPIDKNVVETKKVDNNTPSQKASTPVVKRPMSVSTPIDQSKKMGEHAPEPNDPNYTTKVEDWKKNYPNEYKAFLESNNNAGFK